MASLLLPRVTSHQLRSSSSKNASWLVVSALSTAGVFSVPSTTTPRCDGRGGNNDDVLPRDNDGNIDWSKAMNKFQGGDIWGAVASAAGGKVRFILARLRILVGSSSGSHISSISGLLSLTCSFSPIHIAASRN